MKLVIYTAIFGNFDKLKTPKIISNNVKYICFSDKKIKCKPWEIRIIKPKYDANRENRRYKILSYKFFPDHEYSIYLDGRYTIMRDLSLHVKEWLGNNDIAVLKHPKRNCLYEEAEACIKGKKDDIEIIKKQINKYKKEGYPENNGLTANGFIIRRHTKKIKEFNESWWNEVKNYSFRDQISFCYVIYKLNLKYTIIPIPSPLLGNKEYLKIKYHGNYYTYLKIYIPEIISSLKRRINNLFNRENGIIIS